MINNPMTPPVRTLAELGPIVPELFVVLGAFALLMLDLFIDPRRRIITHVLAVATLLGAAVMIAMGVGGQGSTLADMFVRDAGADLLRTPALVGGPRDQMLSNFIATYINRDLNWGMAAALALLLLVMTLSIYLLFLRLVGAERIKLG